MKTLKVFETMTGEWCAATWSADCVFAKSADAAIKEWRARNKGKRVKVEVQK